VWSPPAAHAERFAEENDCVAVGSAEAAVSGASIVITATTSKDPVLDASWIAPGTFVAAMGSNVGNRRELPANLVRKAGLIAVDDLEQARIEAGDLLLAYGSDPWANVVELKNVVRGYDAARVTIFESLGIGVEDVAAAGYVYERAVQLNSN
jgi:ornithine cyclodeaminase/alanine dehydrogenase-like protein (mu-crystallin family)